MTVMTTEPDASDFDHTAGNSLTPGQRLQGARLNAGFNTTAEAARAHNFHRQNLSDHEADRRKISPEQALIYAQAFGTSPSWLLFGQGDYLQDISARTRLVPVCGYIADEYYPLFRGEDGSTDTYYPVSADLYSEAPLSAFYLLKGGINVYICCPRDFAGIRAGDLVVVTHERDGLHRNALKTAQSKRQPHLPVGDADPTTWTIVGVVVQIITPRQAHGDVLLGDSTLLLT